MENREAKIHSLSREQITETKAFRELDIFGQSITQKLSNIKLIRHGFNVSMNMGFDVWNSQTQTTPANRAIIKELTSNPDA